MCWRLLSGAAEEADGVGGIARGTGGAAVAFRGGVFDAGAVAFAGCEEEIGFKTVLACVEIVVAAAESVKRLVSAAFNDASGFDDKNLFGTANGGKAVRDDEGAASAHEVTQTFLDERFGFLIKA